ncbi:polysaccharide biosynthesis protein [Owenweeksia hongkongensis]|uniref:polysaccharide biosynthesis protein n=1 Tax=Owenweeksia hongkongensis TaxID=253245 RepID=UPI003A944600
MIRKFVLKYADRYLARWIILAGDIFLVSITYFFAVVVRFNFDLIATQEHGAITKLPVVLFFYAIGFLVTRSYVGIIRHTSIRDAANVLKGALFAASSLFVLSFVESSSAVNRGVFFIPSSILLIHFLCVLVTLIGLRFLVKYFYEILLSSKRKMQSRVLIYGAGSSGLTTMRTLSQDATRDFDIIGFVDDNQNKFGKAIGGVFVYSPSKVFSKAFIKKHRPDQLIISIQKSLTAKRKKEIVELCLEFGLEVKIVPPLENWIQGELSTKQIKSVKIEDLLERDPIILDNVNISREIKGKVVLVTGAAGSIGSEISRQLLHYQPRKIILLDQAESALYDLESEIKVHHPELFKATEFVIGDVSNRKRMNRVFEAFEPDLVFHAAAYKHVPLMESNPYESVNVNVFGTRIIADLAVEYRVEKFVMVSTDKAVNPTNVMGATKRTAEIYVQSLAQKKGTKTQFITTRFGNVLGSNGSVIPLFKRQIENGGPITLTDKRITRYFMTIPEACNLVLEAGSMGQGGEIFVFDMGESVRIYDLAKKMVMLSGLELDKDIEIKEVGLRPGEKLYEELLAIKENTKETHHPKILIAETTCQSHSDILKQFEDLKHSLLNEDNLKVVAAIKKIVPEFISNNSIFASLDLKKIVND